MMVNNTAKVIKYIHKPKQYRKWEYCLCVGTGSRFAVAVPVLLYVLMSVPTKNNGGLSSQNAAGPRNIVARFVTCLSSLPVLKL